MRKLSLILAVPLLLLLAQSASAQQRHIGFFGGVNIGDIKWTPTDAFPSDTRVGPAFGLVGDLGLGTGNMLYLRLEPMYVMKGAKIPEAEKWGYVEVPLLLRVAFGSSSVRPYILAGPSVGFRISAKEDSLDVKHDLKSTSISGRAGAGLTIRAGKRDTHVFLEGQYELGLANVLEDNSSFGTGVEAKTNGILLVGGVLFSFSGVY